MLKSMKSISFIVWQAFFRSQSRGEFYLCTGVAKFGILLSILAKNLLPAVTFVDRNSAQN